MEVSVVIPTYNEAGNIKHLIKSLYSYLPPNSEVIIVDAFTLNGTAYMDLGVDGELSENEFQLKSTSPLLFAEALRLMELGCVLSILAVLV